MIDDRTDPFRKAGEAIGAVIGDAVAGVLKAYQSAFDLIQSDPHVWSARPCQTCAAVTAILNRPFGCDLYRQQKEKR